jgi:hypothetical protein
MLNKFCINQKHFLAYNAQPSGANVSQTTGPQPAARQSAVWRASLETGRQDDSVTRRKGDNDICCVVAINAQCTNQPPYLTVVYNIVSQCWRWMRKNSTVVY